MKLLLLVLVVVGLAGAQAQVHSVASAWQDTVNPTGTTYSVYRIAGLCSATPVFPKPALVTGVTVMNYLDLAVVAGAGYCYAITATLAGSESGPSAAISALVPTTFPPTNLTVSVH